MVGKDGWMVWKEWLGCREGMVGWYRRNGWMVGKEWLDGREGMVGW